MEGRRKNFAVVALAGGLWVGGGVANAQPIPLPPPPVRAFGPQIEVTRSQGLEFVTVSDPNVAPVPPAWEPLSVLQPGVVSNLGQVTQPFRISRSELTNGEYFTFLQAWLPHSTPELRQNLLNVGLSFLGGDAADPVNYRVRTGREQWSAVVPWRVGAIYCNWLCNDRRTDAAAFASGAYDVSTFATVPDPVTGFQIYTDQRDHTPGAAFYIPSLSEQLMAMHWDPNRNGPGQGGWWYYNLPQNSSPLSGLPGTPGAQTSAGLFGVPALSYLDVQNAWGLFDVSGGAAEWTETQPNAELTGRRIYHGSATFGASADLDGISIISSSSPRLGAGLRVAASVPTGSPAGLLILSIVYFSRRRIR